MDSLFVRVPSSELPLLGRNSRLDMLDLYNYKMTAKGENLFGGNSLMLEKDENHVLVKLTEVSRCEMVRLMGAADTLLACVHTVFSPVADSRVRFYRMDWSPDTTVLAFRPELSDFFLPSDSLSQERQEELRRKLSTLHVEAAWSHTADGVPALTYRVSVATLAPDDRTDAERCLHPVTFRWAEGKMVREE